MWHILLLQTAQPVDKTLSGDSALLKICLGLQARAPLCSESKTTQRSRDRELFVISLSEFLWWLWKRGKERTLLSKVSVPEAVPTCTSCPCTQECTPFLWMLFHQLTLAGRFSCSFPAGLHVLDGECLWQVTSLFLSVALLFSAAVPGFPDSRRPLHTETRRLSSPFVWGGTVLMGSGRTSRASGHL